MARFDTLSVLTDFGLDDEAVGVLKSVIRDIAPHVGVIDLTHGIAPFDVKAGALALARAISYVPAGVVMGIVDPGVGTARRAVAIEVAAGAGVVIGPDNGLLAPAVALAGGGERAVALTNVEYQLAAPGPTFAGRDIFAPAAAHLCNGVPLEALGELVDVASLLPATIPLPRVDGDDLVAEVMWVDRFGNAQMNIGPDELPADWGTHVQVRYDQPVNLTGPAVRAAQRVGTYADLGPGSVGILTDSAGMLALCLNRRSAADELGLIAGDQITLSALDGPPVEPTTVSLTRHPNASDRRHSPGFERPEPDRS